MAAGSGLSSSSAFVCVAALSVLAALHQIVPRLVRLMQSASHVPLDAGTDVSTERVVTVCLLHDSILFAGHCKSS